MQLHQRFMTLALEEARAAAAEGEIPVGAVLVREGQVLARAHNRREQARSATAHAEVLAIEAGCRALGRWRLEDCDLYVTLEPCPMCAGAILAARIRRVFFGAYDPRMGAVASTARLLDHPADRRPDYEGGVLQAESAQLLQAFFSRLR